MQLTRSAGIVLHPTSLPSGRLDGDAYAFVDWLAAAGVDWWQLLPLTPPDSTGSPYFSDSAFAAWPGLLAEPDAPVSAAEAASFRERHAYWIGDWEAFAGAKAVTDQVRFEREWSRLRAYARERDVRLIGDVPIYIAPGSADHRAHPELFLAEGVAGCPPDGLGPDGQHWGNPLYDWPANRREGYRWWIERFRRSFELVDVVRVDHFRGFVAYWFIPSDAPTAACGHWRPGPGAKLFRAVEAELGALPLIAEDLGIITDRVFEIRDELELPGMAVLQFAFDGVPGNPHHPANFREQQVVYTGTHDSDTARGWWERELDDATRERSGLDPAEPWWSLVELALGSRAALALLPVQDVLGLGHEARMNLPGTVGAPNWQWRLQPGQLTPELAARLRRVVEASGRLDSRSGVPD